MTEQITTEYQQEQISIHDLAPAKVSKASDHLARSILASNKGSTKKIDRVYKNGVITFHRNWTSRFCKFWKEFGRNQGRSELQGRATTNNPDHGPQFLTINAHMSFMSSLTIEGTRDKRTFSVTSKRAASDGGATTAAHITWSHTPVRTAKNC